MTAVLSLWTKQIPTLPAFRGQQEIPVEFEQYLEPCSCGGTFKKGAQPRCPHCNKVLSAEAAADYIERNAPGTKRVWRWQRNWHEAECIVIEKRSIGDNFIPR
jgi:phage FluMu protein Com